MRGRIFSPVLKNIRSFSTSSRRDAVKIENVMILGSGIMGHGIANATALAGNQFKSIVLHDINQKALDKARTNIAAVLSRMKKKNESLNEEEILSRIDFSTTATPKSTENLLIVEAITENLELKQKTFAKLNDDFGKLSSVILATNTSSLPCSEIAKNVTNLDRYGGLHFFSPVVVMKLVEIVRVPQTSDDTFNSLFDYVKCIGKVPVACKDTPGFIVNRLLIPYMSEAVAMLERGDASARDIDTAMKLGAGYPMGPFELMDFVGLDTSKFIIDGWVDRGYKFVQPSKLLDEKVKAGKIGKKAGSGFYDY